jgi:hypothetical protein
MDNTNIHNKTTLNRPKIPQGSTHNGNLSLNQTKLASKALTNGNMSGNSSMMAGFEKPPGTGKALKKKKVSIGSAH